MKATPVPLFCYVCDKFMPPNGCRTGRAMPTNNISCEDYRPIDRRRNGWMRAAKVAGVLAAVIAALVSLQLLPWATAAGVADLRSDMQRQVGDIKSDVREIRNFLLGPRP